MVPVSAWRSGNFTRRIILRPQQVRRIVLIRGSVPVVPTTANLHYSSAAAVRHPIVLSRTFAVRRLAAKAPDVARISFNKQQTRIRSITSVRPELVSLPPRHAPATHPVYQPVKHAPMHVTAIKPVMHRTPVAHPAAHRAAPLAKPVVHRAAPLAKPVVHRAVPLAKPVVHRAAPLAKPVVHRAAPARQNPSYIAQRRWQNPSYIALYRWQNPSYIALHRSQNPSYIAQHRWQNPSYIRCLL